MCLCEYRLNFGTSIGTPTSHQIELEIVRKNLNSSRFYITLYNAAINFRYKPHLIMKIQDKKNKPEIKRYIDFFQICSNEIHKKIKNI